MILIKEEQIDDLETRTFTSPQFKCGSGNKIEKFCTNKDCQFAALCCRDQNCRICGEDHEDCFFGEIGQLTKKFENKLAFQKRVKSTIFNIEDNLVKQLIESRKQLLAEDSFWKTGEKYLAIIDSLFFRGSSQGLTGAQMSELFSQLSLKGIEEEAKQYLQKYEKQTISIAKNLIFLRQSHLDSIFTYKRACQKSASKNIISEQKQQNQAKEGNNEGALLSNSTQFKHDSTQIEKKLLDSKILHEDKEGQSKIDIIFKQLKNPTELKLLFRASQHNFEAQRFHHFCDTVANTFTIIRTQFNKTISAFTPTQWTSKGSHATDYSMQSFLLHLDLNEKMHLRKATKAIYDHEDNGPSFGIGDIYISNKCHQNSKSYANFPYAYVSNSKNYKKENQQTWNIFSGSTKGRYFKIIDYEVFEVIA